MIGIDTNVLIRIFTDDDKVQSQQAKKIIRENGVVFVSTIVLCETTWVLKSRYNFNKKELISCIEDILKASHFQLENRDALWTAFNVFRHNNSESFSDCVTDAIEKLHGCVARNM